MRRRWSIRLRVVGILVILLIVVGWAFGCTSTAEPPVDVDRPVTVYVTSEAYHKGILLPVTEGRWVEYGFGEYEWYALGRDAWYRLFPTLLWPTSGALGRRYISGRSRADLQESAPGRELERIDADHERVAALRTLLDRRFRAGDREHHSYQYDLTFRARGHYWLFNNCHDEAANWLDELGCDVSWVPVRAGLEVE